MNQDALPVFSRIGVPSRYTPVDVMLRSALAEGCRQGGTDRVALVTCYAAAEPTFDIRGPDRYSRQTRHRDWARPHQKGDDNDPGP